MIISFTRHAAHCEHCGKPITNCYIVRDENTGFKIRVGSTCIKHFTKLDAKGIKYIVSEIKTAEKNLVKKDAILLAVASGSEEEIRKSLSGIYWQENYKTAAEAAEQWADIFQRRYDKRVEDLNAMLKNKSVVNQ